MLAQREADAWERRLRELVAHAGKPKQVVLKYRERIIKDAITLFGMSEGDATAWVDGVLGLESSD